MPTYEQHKEIMDKAHKELLSTVAHSNRDRLITSSHTSVGELAGLGADPKLVEELVNIAYQAYKDSGEVLQEIYFQSKLKVDAVDELLKDGV